MIIEIALGILLGFVLIVTIPVWLDLLIEASPLIVRFLKYVAIGLAGFFVYNFLSKYFSVGELCKGALIGGFVFLVIRERIRGYNSAHSLRMKKPWLEKEPSFNRRDKKSGDE